MRVEVSAPDGTPWTVRRVEAPWRLRHRAELAPDLLGVLLWLLAWLVLLVESLVWMACWLVQRARHALGLPWIVEARTPGPPDRLLRWFVVGAAASAGRVTEVAAGLADGEDVAATAAIRAVGDGRLRG